MPGIPLDESGTTTADDGSYDIVTFPPVGSTGNCVIQLVCVTTFEDVILIGQRVGTVISPVDVFPPNLVSYKIRIIDSVGKVFETPSIKSAITNVVFPNLGAPKFTTDNVSGAVLASPVQKIGSVLTVYGGDIALLYTPTIFNVPNQALTRRGSTLFFESEYQARDRTFELVALPV